jgi:hypothetical protein
LRKIQRFSTLAMEDTNLTPVKQEDSNDLRKVIQQTTEFKTPSNIKMLDLNNSDFVDAPYVPETNKQPDQVNNLPKTENNVSALPGQPAPIPEKVFDPDFTTDIVIGTFDTIQHPLFLALNQRKQKNLRFKDRNQYLEAVKLSYLSDSELKALEDYDDKKILVEKLKSFTEVMAKINGNLQLTPDEILKLRKPTFELIKKSGFDIPPGLGLALVLIDIISNRMIDLIAD